MQYILLVVVVSSSVIAIADTCYLMFGKNALSRTLPAAFPGLIIRDGRLCPPQGSPYVPPAYLITPVIVQVLKLPSVNALGIDTLIAIDTAQPPQIRIKIPMILLKSTTISLHFNKTQVIEFPYEYLLFGNKDFELTYENTAHYLKRYSIGILIGYLFSSIMHDGIMLLFAILFLAFAAFVFRADRKKKFIEYLKVAMYAITPIVVGGVLVAVSGVHVDWIWHLLVFLSTIVMFRAIVAVNNVKQNTGEGTTL